MYNDEGNINVPFDTTNIASSRLGPDLPQPRNHRRNTVDDRPRPKYQLSPPIRFPNVSGDPRFQRCICRCIGSSCAHELLAVFYHCWPSHRVCSRDPTLVGIQSPKRRGQLTVEIGLRPSHMQTPDRPSQASPPYLETSLSAPVFDQ